MPTLTEIAARLRQAVGTQAYAEAETLVPLYCSLLERDFASQSPSSAEARRLAEEARDLYQWMARTIVLHRAHFAADLQLLNRLSSYLKAGTRTPHTFELEG